MNHLYLSILFSVFLLDVQRAPFLHAFGTTTYSRHDVVVPQSWHKSSSSSSSSMTKTLIHRSSVAVVALASSNEDEQISSTSSSSSEFSDPQEEQTKQKEGTNVITSDSSTGTTELRDNSNQQTTPTMRSQQLQSQSQSQRPSPTAQDLMLAMGTNPRRIVVSMLSATGIALAGNFLGVTSRILTAIPEEKVEATGIDTYFPRGDYKRCQTEEYTFVVPREWVADTFVELAKAQRKVQQLDYSMQQSPERRSNNNGKITTLPDSAYGPPGRLNEKGVSQAGDTNVSVIVSSGFSGFTLKGTLGTPTDAAEILLSRSIAPEGSGRVATLLRSVEDDNRNGQTYKFEYIVDRGTRGPPLRNIAVIAASPAGDKLYTLTVVAPAEKWKDDNYDAKLRKIADSFHLR